MPRHTSRAHAAKLGERPKFKHVFAEQKAQTRLVVRTFDISRAREKVGVINLGYAMGLLVWPQLTIALAWRKNHH